MNQALQRPINKMASLVVSPGVAYTSPKRPFSGETMSDESTIKSGPAWKWRKINEVALELGTTGQTIRNAINKIASFAAESVPALSKKPQGADFLVQAGAVFEHLRKYASPQLAARLTAPRGYQNEAAAGGAPGAAGSGKTGETGEVRDLNAIYDDLNRKVMDETLQPATRNSIVVALAELRRREESLAKLARMIPEDEHIAALRTVGSVWAGAVEEFATVLAKAVHSKFERDTGMKLDEQHMGSLDLMQAAICEAANDEIVPRVRNHVENEIAGLEELL